MKRYTNGVKIWIWIGVIMVLFQIVIGGITRLTGSGLSITKWEIVTGTLPPTSEKQWAEEFDLYRQTPQYQKINAGMSLSEFKFIYYWEYIHRLWARLIFLVFFIPFLYFLAKKKIDRPLILKLLGVVGLAIVVASIGWIMVASGLTERPWVNAYKLSIHLLLGLTLFGALAWVAFSVSGWSNKGGGITYKPWLLFLLVLVIQIFIGGVMSGTRAALFYPTWPDMHGELVPQLILDGSNWTAENFVQYDRSLFMAALVQFSHRLVAYALLIMGIIIAWKQYKLAVNNAEKNAIYIFSALLFAQVLIGIITLMTSWGEISVFWGVMHQAIASILLMSVLLLIYLSVRKDRLREEIAIG